MAQYFRDMKPEFDALKGTGWIAGTHDLKSIYTLLNGKKQRGTYIKGSKSVTSTSMETIVSIPSGIGVLRLLTINTGSGNQIQMDTTVNGTLISTLYITGSTEAQFVYIGYNGMLAVKDVPSYFPYTFEYCFTTSLLIQGKNTSGTGLTVNYMYELF